MKKNEKNAAAAEKDDGRVEVRVPRGEDVFICINGVGYLLPAMQVSRVPPEVAAEFYRSERAKDRFFETTSSMRELK